jgi:hypothetical protein
MSDSSSLRRFCVLGTSKKPPQVGQFLRGGRDVGFDDFKHAAQRITKADRDERWKLRKPEVKL